MSEEQKPKAKKKSRKLLVILIVAVVLAGGGLSLAFLQVQGYARSYGHVTARQDPLLRASQKGPIAKVLVQQDQQVQAGDLIMQLDDSLVRMSLQQGRTAVTQAAQEIRVFQAECLVAKSQRSYDRLEAQLLAQAAKVKKDRMDQLQASRGAAVISSQEVEEVRLAYELAKVRADRSYEAEVALEKEHLTSLEEKLEASRSQVQLYEQQLAGLEVRSPIAGRVVLNPVVVGEVVDANVVLGRVFDETVFTIEARFPERHLYKVEPGQEVEIKLMGRSRWDEPLAGEVIKIGQLVHPQESGDGYLWLTVSIEPGDVRIYPGQDAEVSVLVGKVSLFKALVGL